MFPINGPRFKCRNCDDFDFCESCFKTRKHNSRHSFGRINEPGQWVGSKLSSSPSVPLCVCRLVTCLSPPAGQSPTFCGRAGKQLKRHRGGQRGMLIEDWSRAVKSLSVSSSVNQASRLIDSSEQYWQSSGSQGKVAVQGILGHVVCLPTKLHTLGRPTAIKLASLRLRVYSH